MEEPIDDAEVKPEAGAFPAPRNILLIVWRHKWLVLLGLVVGLAGGALVYCRSEPIYRSAAQLLVIKKRSDFVPMAGGDMAQSYLEDYVSTHLVLLKSPVILEQAVNKGRLEGLKTFAGQGNMAAVLAANLVATRDTTGTGTSRTIINLSFEGPVPEDTAKVLDTVIGSYTDFLESAYRNVSLETEALYIKARDLLRKDIAEREKKYREFRETSPTLWKSKEGANVHQWRVGEIEGKRSALILRKAEVEGRVRAVLEAKKAGKLDVESLLASGDSKEGALAKDGRRPSEEQLLTLLLEEQELLEDFGEDHPRVRSVRAKIARTRDVIEREQEPREERPAKDKGAKREATIDRYLRSAQYELSQIEQSQKVLEGLLVEERKEAKALNQYEIADDEFRAELARTQQLYDQTIKRLQEVNLVRDFGGYDAKVIAPPGLGARIAPSLGRYLLLSAVLGLLAGIGLAYLAEATDTSFRSPDEIRRRLGLPILGHIPLYPQPQKQESGQQEPGADLTPAAVCVCRPTSLEAEAYRSLRTALFFATKRAGCKVIQITSPNMGDGKTTLGMNLAVAISQSGKRVVLVDADLRRSRIHHLFGMAGTASITDVLCGDAPLAEVVRQTGIPGLSVTPCTNRPSNPAEVLSSPAFDRLLGDLREQYDYVIVDSPPLLAVTDPCIVAGRVDGVVLTIRVAKNGRPAAERAKEMLLSMGIRVLGVIVNGTGKLAGDYGYKHYAYDEYSYQYRSSDPEPDNSQLPLTS